MKPASTREVVAIPIKHRRYEGSDWQYRVCGTVIFCDKIPDNKAPTLHFRADVSNVKVETCSKQACIPTFEPDAIMNRNSPLHWSFSIGTWYHTNVRVSWFFLLLVPLLCIKLQSFPIGLAITGVLFLTILCHEFGHVAAARATGGAGDEILIWPLGGLAFVQPGGTYAAQFWTAAAGPLVNALLCLVTLPAVLEHDVYLEGALNPFVLPPIVLGNMWITEILILIFDINFLVLLLNLIPVYPLDGGRMTQAVISARIGGEMGRHVYGRIGFFCALLLLLGGLIAESVWLTAVAAIILALNIQETMQLQGGEAYDESFMGYDFSQGYTSLEREEEDAPPQEQRAGPLTRWKQKREEDRARKEVERDQEAEVELDRLLEKVHQHGMESLSATERRQLEKASKRIRSRSKDDD
ncbi:MAG: hypothetical protein CMJ78_02865 [Planctomycetaceae bacterium]|nr:hypothetical protein [Planctomycetaceae bacterium]